MTTWLRCAVLGALLALAAASARSGEIIGNTYISEKDGVIEITAAGWNLKDTETPGQGQIAEISPREAIRGFTPKAQFYRLANPGGVLKPEAIMQQLRDALLKNGMEGGQFEPRRIAGKRVLSALFSMTRDVGKANLLVYMLEGEKSLYWAQFTANVVVWDEARQQFDEVMEKVKY